MKIVMENIEVTQLDKSILRQSRITWRGKSRKIRRIIDTWTYCSEWWKNEIHRYYFLIETTDGSILELFREEAGNWILSRIGD